MSGVFKISEAGTIALHAAVFLAAHPDRVCRTREIADTLPVSGAHLVKVLQRLTRAGLATATRGPKGGFALAREANKIALREVFEAIEGKLAPVQCLLRTRACDGKHCILGGMVERVNRETLDYLSATRLSELVRVYGKKTTRRRK
jgi:Rrf2 family protein